MLRLNYFASFHSQLQRNVQSLIPTAQYNAQSHSAEGRLGTSSQAGLPREIMKRPQGDEVAVIQGLASLTSRTGTLVVIIGGLVRLPLVFYDY